MDPLDNTPLHYVSKAICAKCREHLPQEELTYHQELHVLMCQACYLDTLLEQGREND